MVISDADLRTWSHGKVPNGGFGFIQDVKDFCVIIQPFLCTSDNLVIFPKFPKIIDNGLSRCCLILELFVVSVMIPLDLLDGDDVLLDVRHEDCQVHRGEGVPVPRALLLGGRVVLGVGQLTVV